MGPSGWETEFIVPDGIFNRKRLLAFCALAPLMAGCSGTAEMLQSDLIRSVSIETPPLSPDKPVTAEDLVSADGACPGMAPAAGDANALANGAAGAPPTTS